MMQRPPPLWSDRDILRNLCPAFVSFFWCQPVRQEFMENECEALPSVAYPGVRDNRSMTNTKTGYDDDDDVYDS